MVVMVEDAGAVVEDVEVRKVTVPSVFLRCSILLEVNEIFAFGQGVLCSL